MLISDAMIYELFCPKQARFERIPRSIIFQLRKLSGYVRQVQCKCWFGGDYSKVVARQPSNTVVCEHAVNPLR